MPARFKLTTLLIAMFFTALLSTTHAGHFGETNRLFNFNKDNIVQLAQADDQSRNFLAESKMPEMMRQIMFFKTDLGKIITRTLKYGKNIYENKHRRRFFGC